MIGRIAFAIALAAALTATTAHARDDENIQAPRGQEVQAPRAQDVQAPRQAQVEPRR